MLSEYLFANVAADQHRSGRRDTVNSTDHVAAMAKARVEFCDTREAADHGAATLVLGIDRNGSTPLCSLNLRWNDPSDGTTTA